MRLSADITLDEAYRKLSGLPPQTYVDIGPGVQIKAKANGVPVMRLHYDAIPERNRRLHPEWKEQEQRKYTKAGWQREQEIEDEAGGGERLFAYLLAAFGDKIIISDPKWWPNPAWRIVGGMDHGKTNPTVQIKAYVDFEGNIYLCGEYYQMKTEAWQNQIWQNAPLMASMFKNERGEKIADWVAADPSIFYDGEAQLEGSYVAVNAIYRKHGVDYLQPFEGNREDLTFEERLNQHWADLGNRRPTLFIVCRNESDRRQPGLHPYDCPNLLWELRRIRRAELTSKQLDQRNPTEKIVDKLNHAWDSAKYLVLRLPRPTAIPISVRVEKLIEGLNPMSSLMAQERFFAQQRREGGIKTADIRGKKMMRK